MENYAEDAREHLNGGIFFVAYVDGSLQVLCVSLKEGMGIG